MKILITICGRAGSKGFKNKNLKDFLGYPLVDYTIAAAQLVKENNQEFEVDICLNSDSPKLLKLGRRFSDVEVIKRPKELAQDTSPKILAIKYGVKEMEKKHNQEYDYVIDLDITSPLRKVSDIEKALQKTMEKETIDVVYSVVEARRNPYFNMVERNKGEIKQVKKTNFTRRQDAPKVYDMNASIYCYKRDSLLKKLKNSPFDGKSDIIIMKDTAILDIDSKNDFELMAKLADCFFNDYFKEIKDKVISFSKQ